MSEQGIRTVYKNISFRSRAEARWAAFFDGLGWSWEYEPIDLEGYIPDFILSFRQPLLVEVKGGVLPQNFVGSEVVRLAASKVEVSGWDGLAVVVGAAPDMTNPTWPLLGRFAAMVDGDDVSDTDAALFRCGACQSPSLHSYSGPWRCFRCGAYDGDRYVEYIENARELWAQACNVTQWRATGSD